MKFNKILKNQKQIFVKNLEKAYTEGIYSDTPTNRKLGRVGMSYKKYNDTRKDIIALQDDIYDAIEDLTKKRFKNDDYWNGVKSIKNKIGEVVEKYQDKYKDLQLYISVEDGGYRENNGSKWKEYKINIENGNNNSILEGVINCHAAGTVEDPFSEYDCSVIISPSNLDDDEISKLRKSIKKEKINDINKSYQEGVYSDTFENRKLGRVGMSYKKEEQNKDKKQNNKGNKKFSKLSEIPWERMKEFKRTKFCRYKTPNGILYRDFFERTSTNRYSLGSDYSTFYDKEISSEQALAFANGKKLDKYDILTNKIKALWGIKGRKLDHFIQYINNLDEVKEDGIKGIKLKISATEEDKKVAIVKFYAQAAKKLLGSDSEKNVNEVIQEALENFESNK